MTDPDPRPPRRPSPSFRPRFTIGVFYLAAFFFVFSILQILPDSVRLLSEMRPGPEQEKAAYELARSGSNPLLSAVLSLAATLLGSHYEVLPGMREG